MTPLITLFTAPKPFRDVHIRLIQRNAIATWKALGENVEIALIGAEAGTAETAAEFGLAHFPQAQTNQEGTPLISSIFALGRSLNSSPLLAYVNTDILLLSDFVENAGRVFEQAAEFLAVGQRWDLDMRSEVCPAGEWERNLRNQLADRGRLHPPMGSDYFLFPRACFQQVPDFAVGRAGWDNWMIYQGRRQGWKVIDATGAITAIHQDHDYSHLPGGKPHYRLPESDANVRLAGGKRVIFHLEDCDWRLKGEAVVKQSLSGKKLAREIETWPVRRLNSGFLNQAFFAMFHPVKAYREFRAKAAARKPNRTKEKVSV